MNNNYRDQYLMHYGVLGMKWGRRKRKVSTNSIKKPTTKANDGLTPPPSKRRMTNKELKARVNRLKLENEYRKAIAEANPKKETVNRIDRLVKQADNVAKLGKSAVSVYETLQSLGVLEKRGN